MSATDRDVPAHVDALRAALRLRDEVLRLEEDKRELGGNPRDLKNLWPEMWSTPGTPLTSRGPFPPYVVGAQATDAAEESALPAKSGVVTKRRH